jgi:hypothetical protein
MENPPDGSRIMLCEGGQGSRPVGTTNAIFEMPWHDAETPIMPNLSTTSRRALYAQGKTRATSTGHRCSGQTSALAGSLPAELLLQAGGVGEEVV